MWSMPSVSQQDSEFEKHWRRQQDRQHRPIADKIYRLTFGNIRIERVDEGNINLPDDTLAAMDRLGVDFRITLPNRMVISGQEKYLSYECRHYNTVTISSYSWGHCAAQIYFCGYLTQDGMNFDPWLILNWPAIAVYTYRQKINWQLRDSVTGFKSFYHTNLKHIPQQCIIASSGG